MWPFRSRHSEPLPSAQPAPSGPDIVAKLLEATLHFRVASMRYHSVSSARMKDYLG